jgi:ribosomal subunit interface protein
MSANVSVSGIHMELGDALRSHVQEQMTLLSEKYFGDLVTCRVTFKKENKGHTIDCHIYATIGRHMEYVSEAESDHAQSSFKIAYEKLAKQLRRDKRARHEDKPNPHLKEQVLEELAKPDPDPVE